MTTASKTEEMLKQERRFWDAMKEKDARAASRMTDDGCIATGVRKETQCVGGT